MLTFPLAESPLSIPLLREGCSDFHSAIRWVHALPYGRNTNRADYSLVASERRGTCSTKHALLAALAREARAPVALRTGIFLMSEDTTPGVGSTLRRHGMASVPEAHCFLAVGDGRVDITFPESPGTCNLTFIAEMEIAPEDIGATKLGWHRSFLAEWARDNALAPDAVWAAREACVAALSSA